MIAPRQPSDPSLPIHTDPLASSVRRIEEAVKARPEVTDMLVVETGEGDSYELLVVVALGEWAPAARYRMLFAALVDPAVSLAVAAVTEAEVVRLSAAAIADLAFRPGAVARYVAPATETERAVVRIVEDIVACGPVSTTDHFLDVGGDSLRLLELLATIEDEMGVVLDVEALLECRDLRELAVGVGVGLDRVV